MAEVPPSYGRKKLFMESIADSMENGMLPGVPETLSLEQSLFPVKLHPSNASLERDLRAWASHLGPRCAQDVTHTIEIYSLSCYFWPCTLVQPPRRMFTLLKLMYWFFLVEHVADDSEPPSTAAEQVLQADKAACRGVVEALVGAAVTGGAAAAAAKDRDGGEIPVVLSVALEWWAEMREDGMSLKQQARFIAEVTKYLQAQKLERLLMMSGPAPCLEVYMPLRRDTAAGGAICMGAEFGLGIELDEEAASSSLILQLQDAVIDHAFWVNDIYSFPKEFAKGECLNLLYLLHARNNSTNTNTPLVPFHVAISQAWQMVKARQLDCARLAQQIALSPRLASKPGLLSYVEALCLLTSGNWAWTLQVPRYNSLSERPSRPSAHFLACSLPYYTSFKSTPDKRFRGNVPLSLRPPAVVVTPLRGNAPLSCRARSGTSSVLPLTRCTLSLTKCPKWQALSFV